MFSAEGTAHTKALRPDPAGSVGGSARLVGLERGRQQVVGDELSGVDYDGGKCRWL